MDSVLEIRNLTKSFGSKKVIDNLSFSTQKGEVFGFLGPNGAGKTTTIKMITGLLETDAGEITIDGHNVRTDFERAMENVGAIVENPEMYTYMSGRKNLEQYARMRKGVTKERIDEVVRMVGLENRIGDKVKKYSLGMKQRLGVAQAIMHRPKLLILDEPTNGLDPAGIKELRDILKSLAHEEGASVLVSSHLLSEMQQMCDRVAIIGEGALISVRSVKELTEQSGGEQARYRIQVRGNAAAAASALSGFETVQTEESALEVALPSGTGVDAAVAKLVYAQIGVLGVSAVEKSLEDIFIEITSSGGGRQID